MHELSFERFIGKKIVEINAMHPILIFEGEESLIIECSWRLRNEETILVGSSEYGLDETHQEAFRKLSKFLLGNKIIAIKITSAVSDLSIYFQNDILLQVFSDSSIFENWTLDDGKDFTLISFAGGGTK